MINRTRTALVVIADETERRLVKQVLTEAGQVVSAVAQPYQAFAFRQSFDLVVLSIVGLDARDHSFVEVLCHSAPHLRMLLLVPEGRRVEALGFLAAGADAQLPQPFFVDELKMLVNSLLRYEAADALTGLANKPAYETALQREIARAVIDRTTLALGLLDIDDFKQKNTVLGYHGADEVLKKVAKLIESEFRTNDLVARWGGEEFVVIATGLPEDETEAWEQAKLVFKRVRKAVRKRPIPVGSQKCKVTFSGGVALFNPQSESRDSQHLTQEQCEVTGRELFALANVRLAEAKKKGKDRIVFGAKRIAPS